MRTTLFLGFCIGLLFAGIATAASIQNGFRIDDPLVPEHEILSGGVPRDGIPAIDDPEFVSADDADFLDARDRVLGLSMNGVTRAYPLKILNYHEIVNDNLGVPVVISFCPLCGTGIAFLSTVNRRPYTFGVSGLLYNSDVLMYDHQTESLWSQISATAVTGRLKGSELRRVPVTHTTWADWLERHPRTEVLSIDTGFRRDYYHDPYGNYAISNQVMFPVSSYDNRLNAKELVMGLEIDGQFKAYPLSQLPADGERFADRHADTDLFVEYDRDAMTGRVIDNAGEEIPTFLAFWFAWAAFHPETEVFDR